jgi:hypothetical protein
MRLIRNFILGWAARQIMLHIQGMIDAEKEYYRADIAPFSVTAREFALADIAPFTQRRGARRFYTPSRWNEVAKGHRLAYGATPWNARKGG